MSRRLIMVSSITYALKGRDLLRSRGFRAYIERTPAKMNAVGCGYSVYVTNGSSEQAEMLLREANFRILGIMEVGGV